jgi:hypothetical protein
MVRVLHKYRGADGVYSPARRALHERLLAQLFSPDAISAATPAPGEKPTLTLLGGRGGSGKSWFTNPPGVKSGYPLIANNPQSPVVKGSLVINSDDFKERLPEYMGWNADVVHEESSDLAGMAMDMARYLGLNVVYDATMRSPGTFKREIPLFQKAGYNIDSFFLHTAPHVAAIRAMKRFLQGGGANGGRWVPPKYILGSQSNETTFDSLRSLSNRWGLYDGNHKGAPHRCAKGGN